VLTPLGPFICELASDPRTRVGASAGPGDHAVSMPLVVVPHAYVTVLIGPGVRAVPMPLVLAISAFIDVPADPCVPSVSILLVILPCTHVSAVINEFDGVLPIQRLGYMLLEDR